MQFTYDEAYKNVEDGLLNAPSNIVDVYLDRAIRYVVEALLLDSNTPHAVFTDLLGWGQSDVEVYKHFFFCVPEHLPRLYLFKFIEACPKVTQGDIVRYNLYLGVYDFGWSYIDSNYNRGNRISIQSRALYSLKKMFGQIDGMVVDCMSNPSASNMQGLVKLLKMSVEMESNSQISKAPDQLKLSFVEKIKEEGAKRVSNTTEIMGMEFDDLNRVIPAKENKVEQLTLEKIYDELPKEGKDPIIEAEIEEVEPKDDSTPDPEE